MWARVIEICLALWLVLAPFIFGHYPENRALWLNDFACALAVFVLASLSFWMYPKMRFLRRAHLGIIGVGLWMAGYAYFRGGHPAEPGYQNEILVGLTLLLLAIIPNNSSQPPRSWQEFYLRRAERKAPR